MLFHFVLMLSIVMLETIILVVNIDSLKLSSLEELVYNPNKLGIYSAYIVSVMLIPLISIVYLDVIRNFYNLYRSLAVKSLKFGSIKLATKYASILIMMLPLALLLTIIGIISRLYMLTLFSLIPLLLFVFAITKPFIYVNEHNKNIEIELKWFLILMIVIESVGANIRYLITKLRHAPILPTITKELTVVDRDSLLYLSSYVDSLIHRAKYTPSPRLSNIFAGYASRLRSGGDVISWLKSKLNEELMVSEFSAKLYSERVSSIFGQIMLTLYALLPLIAISVYALNVATVTLLNIAVTPLLVILMSTIRPKSPDTLPLKYLFLSLAVMASSSALLYIIIGSTTSIAIGWLLALIASYKYQSILKEISILEKDCIEVMKLMVELRRNGYDIAKAVEYIVSTNIINEISRRKLKLALTMLYQGISLTEASMKIPTSSFTFRFTLFTLGLAHECGGGDPEVFQTLYEYMNRINVLQGTVKRVGTLFDIFAFVNVILIVWVWKMLTPLHLSITRIGIGVEINLNMLYLLIYSSLFGYTMVSSTLRRGVPVIELRTIPFLVVGTLLPLIL